MKRYPRSSFIPTLVLAASLIATTFPVFGSALPILIIDDSNPSGVIFTGTLTNATASDGTTTGLGGIDLANFFTAMVSVTATPFSGGSLQPVLVGAPFQQWSSDTYQGPPGAALNLSGPFNAPQYFLAGSPALVGVDIINMSTVLAELPASGATGLVYPGNSANPGLFQQPIGTWQVLLSVPEPPSGAFLALGAMVFAGLAFVRRARRVAVRP